ncbi:hypothetical protein [Hyphomonas sp.]|uniref:hypothetical protein n=1 Tax=Hyphomonas sp. TaxID=87 RepID=UPI0032F0745F
MTIRERLIRFNLLELQQRYDAAVERGESEVYLALCKFKIDDLKDALATAEKRAAS